MARATKFQSQIPIRFWGLIVKTTVYLLNRLLSFVIEGKSPYKELFSKPPFLTHLKVIGCLCFAFALPRADKFLEKDKPAVLMGYSNTQKGYLLMNLATNKLFMTRDVMFHEHVFPFTNKNINESTTNFLQQQLSVDDHTDVDSDIDFPFSTSDISSVVPDIPSADVLPQILQLMNHLE